MKSAGVNNGRHRKRMNSCGYFRATLGALMLWGLGNVAQADIYVYQLPGGSRIIADHALINRDYKLVRYSRTAKGAGTLISSRTIANAVTDPTAYDRLIRRTATAHQVDAALVKAVMHIESAFNPHAVSHAGAQGLMQLMPDTAQRYGARDIFDPKQNVRAGVLYLKDLQKLFKNNTRLVLAAYNAGENAVLRYRGVPPYSETRDYVRKVMKAHRYYAAAEIRRAEVSSVTVPAARKLLAAPDTAISPNVVSTATVSATPMAESGLIPVASVQPTPATLSEKSL
jgi:hypothetical protein